MRTFDTYWVKIYIGLQSKFKAGILYEKEFAESICAAFCDAYNIRVIVTIAECIGIQRKELGVIVELINFLAQPIELEQDALKLAAILMEKLEQNSVMIMTPNKTTILP